MACSKENSDQTLKKSSSREGWAKPESGCLGKFWTPQPCRYSRLEKVQKSWSFFAVSSALRRELEGMMFRGLLQPRLLYCSMRSQLDYIASWGGKLALISVDFRFTSVFEQAQGVEWMRPRMHFNQQDISVYSSLRLRDFSDHLLTRCLTGPCSTNSRTRVSWNNSEQASLSLVLVCSRQVEMHCRNEQGDLSWLGC